MGCCLRKLWALDLTVPSPEHSSKEVCLGRCCGQWPSCHILSLMWSFYGIFPTLSQLRRDNSSVRIKALIVVALRSTSPGVQLVLSWSEMPCKFGDMKIV